VHHAVGLLLLAQQGGDNLEQVALHGRPAPLAAVAAQVLLVNVLRFSYTLHLFATLVTSRDFRFKVFDNLQSQIGGIFQYLLPF